MALRLRTLYEALTTGARTLNALTRTLPRFPPSHDCLHGHFRPVQTTCRSSSLSCDRLTLRARPSGGLHLTVPCINSFHRHKRSKLDVEARVDACSKKHGLSNLVWHHHSWLNSMDAKLIRPHQHFIRRVSDRVAEYTFSGQRQSLISAATCSPAGSPDSVSNSCVSRIGGQRTRTSVEDSSDPI